VDKAEWTRFLTFAAGSVLLLSLGALAKARPRRQVFLPFLATLAVSITIYLVMIQNGPTGTGATKFHSAFVICSLLALGFAVFLTWAQPARDRFATFSWALLGVVAPYAVFFAFLTVVCWGRTECLG
jgi:hypothetical protein